MSRQHPYPKWLQWLLPFEDPQHPLHWPGDDRSSDEDQVLDDLEQVMGKAFVDRMRSF